MKIWMKLLPLQTNIAKARRHQKCPRARILELPPRWVAGPPWMAKPLEVVQPKQRRMCNRRWMNLGSTDLHYEKLLLFDVIWTYLDMFRFINVYHAYCESPPAASHPFFVQVYQGLFDNVYQQQSSPYLAICFVFV